MTALPTGLIAAYHGTLYRVHGNPELNKRIDVRCRDTEQVLRRYRVRTAAVLTAENPGSRPQSSLVNRIRRRRLESDLKALGLRSLPSSAIDLAGVWPAERGRFVLGARLADMRRLARRHGQNAFLWIENGRPTRMRLCR